MSSTIILGSAMVKIAVRLKLSSGIAIGTTERPNWWFRLWQYLLLGWRWEKAGERGSR